MSNSKNTLDIDTITLELIKRAANNSNWIPEQYTRSEWTNDVCNFLQFGSRNFIDEDRSIIDRLRELEKEVHFSNSDRAFISISDIIYLIGCIKQYTDDNNKLLKNNKALLKYIRSRGHYENCAIIQCGKEFKCTCEYSKLMDEISK